MSSFPEDVCFEIFSKVPVKSSLSLKCVCKTWCSLISSPAFVKMHLDFSIQIKNPNLILKGLKDGRSLLYSISHDSLELLPPGDQILNHAVEIDFPFKSLGYWVHIIGICDGLVCLWFHQTKCFCLWNPATREYKELPKSNVLASIHGFGYDYQSNDYKLITCNFESSLCKVYSLRSNSWKTVENVLYKFYQVDVKKREGVFVSGNFHWLAKRQDSFNVILSLDISNEIFKEIELPEKTLENGSLFHNLGVLEGCLCVLFVSSKVCSEVWVMQDYGAKESWCKRFVITHPRITRYGYATLITSLKSGKILFNVSDKHLVIYDSKKGRITEPNIPRRMHLCAQERYYFESLVPLNTGTYVGRSMVTN